MRDFAVILSADLSTAAQVASMVKQVGTIVDGIKIAESTLLEAGKDVLKRISEFVEGKPILVDLKVADIGFLDNGKWAGTNSKIIKCLENSGATHVTVHGFPGPVSVAEAVNVAKDVGLGVLLLPLMSHAGAKLFFSRPASEEDVRYSAIKAGLDMRMPEDITCTDVTDCILLLGEALDVDGYIGPATRPMDLTRYRAVTRRPIWCPGFGRQDRLGRTLEEQFREWSQIVGPRSAAIVGSYIFGAPDPVAAAKEVVSLRDKAVTAP